ncbi:hypothetical protein BYT27DRAFT_7221667 [Phlegmacium glaucopus]|nr:hypothetical protein BYT27DRAFT_7221667 [Phlegmacium glaucopus]
MTLSLVHEPLSHRTQLLATALAPSMATAGLLHAYNVHTKWVRKHSWLNYDEDLVQEQLARNYASFAEESTTKIRQGSVVNCCWAAVMLGREGVSKVRFIDFDHTKVTCNKKTLKQIARWVSLFIQDAIDNIRTKGRRTQIVRFLTLNTYTGFFFDGSWCQMRSNTNRDSDISNTIYDPLAPSVLRRLRLLGVNSGIPMEYATEVPGDVKFLPLPDEEFQKGSMKETPPALGPLPSIFGLNITTTGKKLYKCLHRDLLCHESKIADEDDIAIIFEDIYTSRSLLPLHGVPTRPALVRWDQACRLWLKNCVGFDQPDVES